ncbi:MAG TPA: hypothetical protein VL172_19410 [Kofleriaceae bacterium]|nr:hypothetical protein [Kofleriaceae bacterium]
MVLVLDFDGTVTDAEVEGRPFRDGYLEDLAVLTGRPADEVRAAAERIEAEVAGEPGEHGWIYDGKIVAPAIVDPYLRMMPVARRLFDDYGCFADPADRVRLLDGILYKYNYQKTATAFRPGAAELLARLAGTPSWVVTNSHTEPVQAKIRSLDPHGGLDWWLGRVRGRARKYVVDEAFTAVADTLALPGLDRPVHLRRRHYHEALAALLAEAGASWDQLLVAGDIFELDLALPLACGARVALVVNAHTPAYERAYVESHPRGHLVTALAEIPALL